MNKTSDILNRIQRGLAGYVSYLASCDMNSAFSEYVLYEPMLRILTAQGYKVCCEFPCPNQTQTGAGDKKRIDFNASRNRGRNQEHLAIEVKWARQRNVAITGDQAKLRAMQDYSPKCRCCLVIFGRRSHIENIEIDAVAFREHPKPVYADFGITRYGCRVYELKR